MDPNQPGQKLSDPQPAVTPPVQQPLQSSTPTNNVPSPSIEVSCTQEAKLCPDGSTVGREGPNCEFAKCP